MWRKQFPKQTETNDSMPEFTNEPIKLLLSRCIKFWFRITRWDFLTLQHLRSASGMSLGDVVRNT